jgi:hypothetical protein
MPAGSGPGYIAPGARPTTTPASVFNCLHNCGASYDAQVSALITAVSDALQKYCRRRFVRQAWDELYNGTGDRRLLLRQDPIQSVRYRPVTVLKIINNR